MWGMSSYMRKLRLAAKCQLHLYEVSTRFLHPTQTAIVLIKRHYFARWSGTKPSAWVAKYEQLISVFLRAVPHLQRKIFFDRSFGVLTDLTFNLFVGGCYGADIMCKAILLSSSANGKVDREVCKRAGAAVEKGFGLETWGKPCNISASLT